MRIHKLILSVFLILTFSSCNQKSKEVNTIANQSVYERVIEKDKIRAAFLNYPPACMKDTKTGDMSGIFVEVLQKACDNIGLELEWSEEVDWGGQIAGLNADRYDIVGSPVWANVVRGTQTTLSTSVYYSGIGVYVRADDNRFDKDFSKINSEGVKVGTIDGETSSLIADQDFPNATKVSSIQLTDISQKFLDLTSSKCDVVLAEPYFAYEYEKNNPGSIKNIAIDSPIRLFGNCYMFKKNEFQMKHMLDVAIQDLINSGYVDKIIQKYEPAPGLFYRVAKPYRTNAN